MCAWTGPMCCARVPRCRARAPHCSVARFMTRRARAQTFAGRRIAVRVDPGTGAGHHKKVVTAGKAQKFGHPVELFDSVLRAARDVGATIVGGRRRGLGGAWVDAAFAGLHAHVGSGIREPAVWGQTASALIALAVAREGGDASPLVLPALEWLDIGGGLGVVYRLGRETPLDLHAVNAALAAPVAALAAGRSGHDGPRVTLRVEPGRYLVCEAGVLCASVTQVREKGGYTFVGLSVGMNALIRCVQSECRLCWGGRMRCCGRPMLYDAYHEVYNLTRLGEPCKPDTAYQIVGPICETGDLIGRDRALPAPVPGDVVVVANAGAYGAVMASAYNMRPTVEQIVLDC